jgi:hypothetical protein
MEHVGVEVDDHAATTAFFVELDSRMQGAAAGPAVASAGWQVRSGPVR